MSGAERDSEAFWSTAVAFMRRLMETARRADTEAEAAHERRQEQRDLEVSQWLDEHMRNAASRADEADD